MSLVEPGSIVKGTGTGTSGGGGGGGDPATGIGANVVTKADGSGGLDSSIMTANGTTVESRSTGPQFRLSRDASDYVDFNVEASGNLTISSTGYLLLNPSGNVRIEGPTNTDVYLQTASHGAGIFLNESTGIASLYAGFGDFFRWTPTGISFFDAPPVVQAAHIPDADGTVGGNQTAINAVIAALENYGLLATS